MTVYLTDGTDVSACTEARDEEHFKEIRGHVLRASGGCWDYVAPQTQDEKTELDTKLKEWTESIRGKRVA